MSTTFTSCSQKQPPSSEKKKWDFADFDRRARAGEKLNVVFIGGSLTWGARSTDPQQTSYRARTGQRLAEYYPNAHFTFWDAAIGGTGSQLAAFRLQRDVIAKKPDLVFIEFAVNDHPFSVNEHRLAAYESLVRRTLLETGAPVVQILFPLKQDLKPGGQERVLDPKHKEVSKAYNTAIADVVPWLRAKVDKGEADPNAMWCYPPDVTHPGDIAYNYVSEKAFDTYLEAVQQKKVCSVPEKTIFGDTYMSWNRQRISKLANLPKGWTIALPRTEGVAFDFYISRWIDDVMVAKADSEPLKVKFNGSEVMLFGECTQKTGKILIKIDGVPASSENVKEGIVNSKCAGGVMRFPPVVAEGLDPNVDHILEIIPQLEADEEIHLESICIAGGKATISIAE